MPHCGYSDEAVDEVYQQLSTHIHQARQQERMTIIAGDFNAEARSNPEHNYLGAAGRFANPKGNERGEWLGRWAEDEQLVLVNTLFKNRWGRIWTHRQLERERQIDYICIDMKYRSCVIDAAVYPKIDLGSDHRAVKA
eukprot:4812040-Karenia_brevis.AAC.1